MENNKGIKRFAVGDKVVLKNGEVWDIDLPYRTITEIRKDGSIELDDKWNIDWFDYELDLYTGEEELKEKKQKFYRGDKVLRVSRTKWSNNEKYGVITEVFELSDGTFAYSVNEGCSLWYENELKEYKEPKFKVGDKVVLKNGNKWEDGKSYKTVIDITKYGSYILDYSKKIPWCEHFLELYKPKQILFKDLANEIRVGEVWENEDFTINLDEDLDLTISFKKVDYKEELIIGIWVNLNDIFTLKEDN